VAASGSSVLVRLWNKRWPPDLKMDRRPRSIDTGLISDLICIVGSRSDSRKRRGEDLTGELGFRPPARDLRLEFELRQGFGEI
jgi:hypothetical protein